MQYSNIRLRAGLVGLVFVLIVSFVSAVPIPATESALSPTLSHSSLNGQNHIQLDTAGISLSGRMATLPADTRSLTCRQHISTNMDNQLVRRGVSAKVKQAFKKIGSVIGKVAKFGLKVVQSAWQVAGKVASFIPGVGKPIGQAIGAASKVAGVVSDKIHANLSPKLKKGMSVMNKAIKYTGYVPRRRDLSEEETLQQRDITEAYYFEERDNIPLENREESYFEADERDIRERYDWE